MVDRLLLQLVTSPIFLLVSSFSLFAIIVKRARDHRRLSPTGKNQARDRTGFEPGLTESESAIAVA
jgi:hypothetical protein